jgi:hypothetical protein
MVRKALLLEEGTLKREGSTSTTTHDSPTWIFQKILVMTQLNGLIKLLGTLNFKRL